MHIQTTLNGNYIKKNRRVKSTEWIILKKKVLKERGYKCEITGLNFGNLELHHIIPVNIRPDLEFDRSNIIVILTPLHIKYHKENGYREKCNQKTLNNFIKDFHAGKFSNINLTQNRINTKTKFTVAKSGFKNNKQVYGIYDRYNNVIIRSQNEDKIIKICKWLNQNYSYSKHIIKDIDLNKCPYYKYNNFRVNKGGFDKGKQVYIILDKNKKNIKKSINKKYMQILCKVLIFVFDYTKDTKEKIQKWIKEVFNPNYETFAQMVSMF